MSFSSKIPLQLTNFECFWLKYWSKDQIKDGKCQLTDLKGLKLIKIASESVENNKIQLKLTNFDRFW